MKKILFLLTVAAALCAPISHAQAVSPYREIGGSTLNISATSTNTTMAATNLAVIEATRALDIAIQPSFKLTGSGTSPVVLKFDTSIDNSNWTVASQSITITAAGTATVSKAQNFTLGAVTYMRLSQVENPNASAITNLTIRYVQKRVQ